ncbi:hypothetical protein GGS26DRAFT_346174 [Hypomontagnella submonticulosa]|nr:hypothetical protein GGS26DRAFT_346174 [Hypomontagnella submonticulosa]
MASPPQDIRRVLSPEVRLPMGPIRSSLSDDSEGETMGEGTSDANDDSISVLSFVSYPDPAGRKGFTVPDEEPAKTVYEAWEIISGEDTLNWSTWRTIFGIKLGLRWRSMNDGFMEVDPKPGYEQGELAGLHENAIREYEAKNRKKGKSYAQDLANRVFRLDAGIYSRLQQLMDDKIIASNKTPFRRREWRIVVLEEGEFQMTELLPERKYKGIFRRRQEKPAVTRYFIVLRGEEVKSTKEAAGWRLFHRHSNPWWRIDARETQGLRAEHREHFEKVNRRFRVRRTPPPPHPRHVVRL